ncbi:MAG TPA: hypothetical protein VJ810_00875 [Blastocatellia bacterium]|nr:hypothetical protein [Blastocatellia bacterium]
MKNRFFLTISAIMVTGALLLSATAQNNNTVGRGQLVVGTKVYLQPDVNPNGDFFTFNVKNNTSQTIPAGTKIYWQMTSTVKGSKILSAPLQVGQTTFLDTGDRPLAGSNPKAWYLK